MPLRRSFFHRALRSLPMPVVSLLFGLACGLVVWVVLDPLQSRALEEIFRSDLEARLDREAQDGFHRFEHYTESYAATLIRNGTTGRCVRES